MSPTVDIRSIKKISVNKADKVNDILNKIFCYWVKCKSSNSWMVAGELVCRKGARTNKMRKESFRD